MILKFNRDMNTIYHEVTSFKVGDRYKSSNEDDGDFIVTPIYGVDGHVIANVCCARSFTAETYDILYVMNDDGKTIDVIRAVS